MAFKNRYVLPIMPLTVPKQYKLLNYQIIDSSSIRYDYTTYKLARPLRAGAEDELIKLDETPIDRMLTETTQITEKPIIITPKIPSPLLKAPVYHPLTVFVSVKCENMFILIYILSIIIIIIKNPAPGVMTYETPLPYSAIDVDNAICPIPLLERPGYSFTNRYLDREVRFYNKLIRFLDNTRSLFLFYLFKGHYSRNNVVEKYE